MKDQKRTLFKKGSYVYIEGDEDVDEVYLIEEGLVVFDSHKHRVRKYDSSAEAGDIFGFISSLSNRPRMESAVVKKDSQILIFKREHFLSLLQKNSDIAVKLINAYADELRAYDNLIFSLEGRKDVFFPDEKKLFNLGKYYYELKRFGYAFYMLSRYKELYPAGKYIASAAEMIEVMTEDDDVDTDEYVPEEKGIYKIYDNDRVIFSENEPGEELYIIKKGRVKIVKSHNDSEVMLSVLKKGDIFGELAIVSNKTRNATAISFGKTWLLPINKDSLLMLLGKSPDILKRIFTAISKRVWFTFIRMEAKMYEKPMTRIYTFLENKLLEENISTKSEESITLNFGIDELIMMTNITGIKKDSIMKDLFLDHNLSFNFGQLTIHNTNHISSKARFHKSRDHLVECGEEEPCIETRESEPEEENGSEYDVISNVEEIADINDVEDIDNKDHKDEFFSELDEEIDKE